MTLRLRLCAVCLLCACSSKTNPPLGLIDAGPGSEGGLATIDLSSGDGPTLQLDLATDPNGPLVVVLSPLDMDEVQYDTLKVQARITTRTTALIDGASVELIIPSTNNLVNKASMSLTAVPDVYEGQIDISTIKSGPSEFTVVASDVSGLKGNAKITYIHDHGPVITFVQPSRPTAKGSVNVEIIVDDSLHPVTDATQVQASIRTANDVKLTQVAGAVPLRLTGLIDFSAFSPALDGTQLINAVAANPKGTVGKATKQFIVDNVGPDIVFIDPVAGQFIGGVLQIKANISDLSDVNDASVVAVFGGNLATSVVLKRTTPAMPEFSAFFDVRTLGRSFVLPAFSIRADDQLGNHSELAEEIVVDNTPPKISLDPPDMRVGQRKTGGVIECSQLFDPVGRDSANDGDVVLQIVTLRARVEDRGNTAPGLAVERVSLVDHGSVYLYVLPASNAPLAVDTDGDGVCDDVNPLLVPSTNVAASNEAIALQLAPIDQTGVGNFVADAIVPPEYSPPCTQIGEGGASEPLPLCLGVTGLDMTLALHYTTANDPAIWTIPPINVNATDCMGLQFDSLNRMPEGPACIAVRAQDNAGNTNVSPPVRVCIDRGGGLCGAGMWPGGALPDCTGTYDKKTNTTSSKACTLDSQFKSPEVRILL